MTRSQLLPIFRTPAQERILARLFVLNGTPLSLTDLSRQTRIPLSTVQREIAALDQAGIIRSERMGNARLVAANVDSPYHAELRSLLLKAFGPATVLASLLAEVRGVEQAYIFGSWARRYQGEPGPAPNDLDLLVVGSPDPSDVYSVAREAEDRLSTEVNPVVMSWDEWSNPTGLAARVKDQPLIELTIEREA